MTTLLTMKNKYMYEVSTDLLGSLRRITNTILVDRKNSSIILNVDLEWFDVLNERLVRMGYSIVHKSKVGGGLTCVYILG